MTLIDTSKGWAMPVVAEAEPFNASGSSLVMPMRGNWGDAADRRHAQLLGLPMLLEFEAWVAIGKQAGWFRQIVLEELV